GWGSDARMLIYGAPAASVCGLEGKRVLPTADLRIKDPLPGGDVQNRPVFAKIGCQLPGFTLVERLVDLTFGGTAQNFGRGCCFASGITAERHQPAEGGDGEQL